MNTDSSTSLSHPHTNFLSNSNTPASVQSNSFAMSCDIALNVPSMLHMFSDSLTNNSGNSSSDIQDILQQFI